jgi:hypothetical protein
MHVPRVTSEIWYHAHVGIYSRQRTFQAGGEDGWHPIQLGRGRQGQHILLELSHCRVTHKLEQTGLQTTAQWQNLGVESSQKNSTFVPASSALHRHEAAG